MENDMELRIRQVMSCYHRRKWAGIAVCAAAIIYLVYLIIFKMDYRITFVVGGFASFLLTVSVFIAYCAAAVVSVLLVRFGVTAITNTLSRDCDPYLFEACLSRLPVLFYKDRAACNFAMAQYYQGNFERSWETMQCINVYKLKGIFKINYYIMMSALYFRKGMGDRAAELEQAYRAGIKSKKDKKYFRKLCAGNNVFRAMENKDYEAAFRFLREREELNENVFQRWQKVGSSMREAQIYAALGEKESARLNIQYVLENGGRLFYIEEAKKLSEELGDSK